MSEYRNYDDEWLLHSDNYIKHVSAMTGESLHSKADIAAELAYRDELINELAAHVERLREPMVEFIHKCDNGEARSRRSYARMKSVLDATPQQNLNAVKREVAKEAFIAGHNSPNGFGYTPGIRHYAEEYANTKYPTTDGE